MLRLRQRGTILQRKVGLATTNRKPPGALGCLWSVRNKSGEGVTLYDGPDALTPTLSHTERGSAPPLPLQVNLTKAQDYAVSDADRKRGA
jgi:hypothetical protein